MNATPAATEASLTPLILAAAQVTGFRPEAILPETVVRVVRSFEQAGISGAEFTAGVLAGRADFLEPLVEAICVGETFFFRQPEHFQGLAAQLPTPVTPGRLRVWSAGCSTGEEPYSLASHLLSRLASPAAPDFEILATDLSERALAVARAGVYGRWSLRQAGPLPPGDTEPLPDRRFRISDRLRACVQFQQHNLLDPAPARDFDVIFCRNVLVYCAPGAIRQVLQNLVAALAPRGLLFLGPMDVTEIPDGMERVGPSEHNTFRRRLPARAPDPSPRPLAPARTRPASPVAAVPSAVETHLEALRAIERGNRSQASELLTRLASAEPGYLPGLLERALWHQRQGEPKDASRLMRELLQRTANLAQDELLPGPEALPVSYYRASAEAYLQTRGSRR